MQRYSPKHGFSEYEIDSLGNLVLFTDAQAKSLADERRIKELEQIIQRVSKLPDEWELRYGPTYGQKTHARSDDLRAALRVGDAK